jgi:uncharacterized cupredoxin-like copper-binding protein
MKLLRALLAVVAVGAAVGAASAFGADAPNAVAPQQVAVTMSEFKFTLKPTSVRKGRAVVFKLANKGAVAHDFRILGKKSALVQPGKSGTLRVTFAKVGRFGYICTLPTHALAGMKGTLVVKA